MTGRNELCPCGKNKKFKKCCGSLQSKPVEITQQVRTQEERVAFSAQHRKTFGDVRPIIHADFQGQKFIAVGAGLYHSPKWKTFHDFLLSFLRQKLTKEWYERELKKTLQQRHPVAQWYWRYCEFQARHREPDEDGLFSGVPDGPSMAFMVLAYDLYVLEDNLALQEKLFERLLHPDQFQGARYEIAVTATMIRAGFDVELENEADTSRKHPEFIATHKKHRTRIAVEAKSRHRPGVLGFQTSRSSEASSPRVRENDLALDVEDLFRKALAKVDSLPLYVFVDVNLPPEMAWALASSGQESFNRMVSRVSQPIDRNGIVVGHAHNLLAITNFAHHYGEPGGQDVTPMVYLHFPDIHACKHPLGSMFVSDVERALKQYGRIPPAAFPSS